MEQEPELQAPMPATYHVFINHRGPDVKKSLASLIYHRLTNCHCLRVFLDKNEIGTGDTITIAILTAIQSASVNIAIFSESYAESRWCLDELCWILRSLHKRNRKVIPVFCDVEPTDLRHIESGCYKNAFENHQRKGRVSIEEMEKWRKALIEASNLSGLMFKTKESDQGEMLENIVGMVLKEVLKWGSLDVAKYPVGLEQAAEDFPINEILKQNEYSDTMIVGIAGMSGAGKSTLAKYLYNMRHLDFNGRSCFLSEVRQKDSLSLQRKLLRDLLGYNQGLQYIDNIAEGRRMLRHCRILLVLDDVDRIDQIDDLIDMDSVGRGSLILITSPDKGLLTRTSPKTLLYQVKPLNRQQARELFCQHAFRQSRPFEGFEDLVEQFLEICKGLSLSLKVLGGHFVGRPDRDFWKRQLVRFSATLHEDITSTLKVSYDALRIEEKEAFLDIGCFLVGEETALAIRALNGIYGSDIVHYLETLHQKCFVEFHYDVQSDDELECRKQENPVIGNNDLSLQYRGYKITMHDQFTELARRIGVTQKPLRLRDFYGSGGFLPCSQPETLKQVLSISGAPKECPTPVRIRGMRIADDSCIRWWRIRGERLQLLVLENTNLQSINSKPTNFERWEISGELVWLRLHNFRSECINFLSFFSLQSLRVLELRGRGDSIEQFFERFMDQFIENVDKSGSPLNELTINSMDEARPSTSSSRSTVDHGHLLKFSESISPYIFNFLARIGLGMVNLCKMVLTNVTSLKELPIDFGDMGSLRHLDLSGCNSLTELPRSFSKLLQLQYLALRDCRNLSIPLDILGNISTLEYADFKGCGKLIALPQGIPRQRHLKYLNLLLTRLSQLPDDLEQLGNLEQLKIGSPALTRLPLSVTKLRGLTDLIVVQCRHLQCLPEGIAGLNIKILMIDCCPIANIPLNKDERTIGVLRDLTLKKTSISEICMVEGVYARLETIDFSENIRLKQVIALPSALVSLNLQNCWELKTLKNLSNLSKLKFLNISGCFELETLNAEGLISLEEIEAEKCWKLKRIKGWNSLKRLNCLKILTDNGIFWEDVYKVLTSPFSDALSDILLTGNVDEMGEEEMQRKMLNLKYEYFFYGKIKRVEIVSVTTKSGLDQLHLHSATTSEFLVEIEELHSHGAILLLLITNSVSRHSFRINFYCDPFLLYSCNQEYITHSGEGGGRRLHIFMWTQYSSLFKDLKSYSRHYVGCSCDASASELEEICTEKGWLQTVEKGRDVLTVCNGIITEFALTHGTDLSDLDETLTHRPDLS